MRAGESIWSFVSRGLCVMIVGLGIGGLGGNREEVGNMPVKEGAVVKREGPRISAEQAVVAALNRVSLVAEGFVVRHPRHVATFTPEGVSFEPRAGGPKWRWRLSQLGPDGAQASGFAPEGGA